MTRADLTTCGRNILPDPKRSPTTFMPAISGPSITSSVTLRLAARASSVSSSMKSVMPATSACCEPFRDRARHARPASLLDLLGAFALEAFGKLQQALRRVLAAVENDILAGLAQFGVDIRIDVPSWPALTMPMSMPA